MTNEIEVTKTRLNTEMKEKTQLNSRLDAINERYKVVLNEFREKEDDYYNKNRNSWNEMDELKCNLSKYTNENEILHQQLSEVKERMTLSESKCNSMEKNHDGLISQIENLKNSKQTIQKTMSDEIASIKQALNTIRYEKSKCDEAIDIVKLENDKLKDLVEREQKRN